jgi:hypothetical protein
MVYEDKGTPRGYDEIGKPIPNNQKDSRNPAWQSQKFTPQQEAKTTGNSKEVKSVPAYEQSQRLTAHEAQNAVPQTKGVLTSPLALTGMGVGAIGLITLAMRAMRK